MKLLVDNALSPVLAELLRKAGRKPEALAALMLSNLAQLTDAFDGGLHRDIRACPLAGSTAPDLELTSARYHAPSSPL